MRIILLGEQARKLETEVDVRLAAFGKLCAGFDTTYGNRSGETGLATDQVLNQRISEVLSNGAIAADGPHLLIIRFL